MQRSLFRKEPSVKCRNAAYQNKGKNTLGKMIREDVKPPDEVLSLFLDFGLTRPWSFSRGTPQTSVSRLIFVKGRLWRRERDSNPRRLAPQRFSRPPRSTTPPSLLTEENNVGKSTRIALFCQASFRPRRPIMLPRLPTPWELAGAAGGLAPSMAPSGTD